MANERNERDAAAQRGDSAREQEESYKVHGDKLDPVIPRGADQQGDADRSSGDDRSSSRPAGDA